MSLRSLLCLPLGETAAQGSGFTRLEAERPREVQMTASVLGIRHVSVAGYRDRRLHRAHVRAGGTIQIPLY